MLPMIIATVAVVVIGFLAFVATRPGSFVYTRSRVIAAPPAALFEQTNDLKKFQDWNPWAKLDPQCVFTYSGPATGVGSSYHWKGNRKVGEGRMTIIESTPHSRIRARLEFIKPFAATNTAEFTFKPEDSGTLVTWSMSGENIFMAKLMGVFVDFDKMVANDFAKGLNSLAALVAPPKA